MMTRADKFQVRPAVVSDGFQLAGLRAMLWPESPEDNHARELEEILAGTLKSSMPMTIFVAEGRAGEILGFLEAGLRSSADGCDVSHPVGYVEGWFVKESERGHGIGRALLSTAEDWARAQGCREMASDADISNTLSQRVHEASGFTVTARSVLYRKPL